MKDASSPIKQSSITILFPASPNSLFTIILSIASIASSSLLQTITPLPAAKPSALTTIEDLFLTYSFASSGLSKILKSAVGMSYFFMNSLAQHLLASIILASLVGPNIFKPFFINSLTIPLDKESSGPTTVKQLLFFANFISLSNSFTFIGKFSDVPPFPGA